MNDPYNDAAWWCAVTEPADVWAGALRSQLGDHDARLWVLNSGSLPPELLATTAGAYPADQWELVRQKWLPRAGQADPTRDLEQLAALGGKLVVPADSSWPAALDELGLETPPALWVLGDLNCLTRAQQGVSIVGARAATRYGQQTASTMAMDLAQQGHVVVSGGAFGVDIAAHRGALSVNGSTIAFMAGGLGNLYPRTHVEELQSIVNSGGALISEVPPSWSPAKWRFLGRNRLIAALTPVTVVVEAGLRSGALSTARAAMNLGRHVGAVPGLVTSSSSSGCHDLIRNGATLVRDSTDVRQMLEPLGSVDETLFGAPVETDHGMDALPPTHRRVWEALPSRGSVKTSTLVQKAGLSHSDVLAALAALQLRGAVESDGIEWRRVSLHRLGAR